MSQFIGDLPNAEENVQGGFDVEIEEAGDVTGIEGSDQSDQVTNSEANDLSFGLGGGDDIYTGTPGEVGAESQSRTVFGDDGDDTIQAGLGEDANFFGDADDDLLVGASGDDTLSGGAGEDELQGGSGADSLLGGADDDLLFGNRGTDTLTGGSGDDTLDGGADTDTLTGQAGADVFRFELLPDVPAGDDASDVFAGGDLDVITDFDATEDTLAFDDDFFSDSSLFSVADDGDDAIVSYDGSDFLRLENVDPEDVNPDDFEIF